MQKPNKTHQRWIAIGLLFSIIIFIGTVIFIPWYNTLNETLSEIDDLMFRVKRYERIIASREEVLTKVEQGRKEINALGYFYSLKTASLAAAKLQKRIKEIIQSAEGEQTSSQVLVPKEQDNLVRIAVKIKILGDMEMLKSLLYELDREKPLMNIEVLTIVPQRGKRNRKTRQIEHSGKVTVTLEVSSYMRKEV